MGLSLLERLQECCFSRKLCAFGAFIHANVWDWSLWPQPALSSTAASLCTRQMLELDLLMGHAEAQQPGFALPA